jgi:hypothetical protein
MRSAELQLALSQTRKNISSVEEQLVELEKSKASLEDETKILRADASEKDDFLAVARIQLLGKGSEIQVLCSELEQKEGLLISSENLRAELENKSRVSSEESSNQKIASDAELKCLEEEVLLLKLKTKLHPVVWLLIQAG